MEPSERVIKGQNEWPVLTPPPEKRRRDVVTDEAASDEEGLNNSEGVDGQMGRRESSSGTS